MKKIIVSFFIVVSKVFFPQTTNFQWADAIDQITVNSITNDPSGNSYITGVFTGTVDFDPGSAVFNLTCPFGVDETFILKLSPLGKFIWAEQIGGSSYTYGIEIKTDQIGNVYCCGYFSDTTDFDPGPSVFNIVTTNQFDEETFVIKLNSSGNLIWVRNFSNATNRAYSIFVDPSNNVFTTGSFVGTADFDPGSGVFNLNSTWQNSYISKLDAGGNFVWAKQFNGPSNNEGMAIDADNSGNIYTTGYFCGTIDFDPGPAFFNMASGSSTSSFCDAFICKLNPSGNFIWAKQVNTSQGVSIAVDKLTGNVYTTGKFAGTTDFNPGISTYTLSAAGMDDAYISKLDQNGNFGWTNSFSTPLQDFANEVRLNNVGEIYVCGQFAGNLTIASTTTLVSNSGSSDIFIGKFLPTGILTYVKQIGSSTAEDAISLTIDPGGNILTTGKFNGPTTTDFDEESGVFYLSCSSFATYVHKMNENPLFVKEEIHENTVEVFPNPTSGQFNLVSEKVIEKTEIKIFNSFGQIVLEKNISNTNKIGLSISDQPAGIYFIEVNADGEIYREKVVKE